MPGEWAEGLSPILNHETRHALKLFAVAGYQGGPKAKSLGRDEGIEYSNRRLRDGEPQLPVGIHGTVIEREYGEWCHHLGEQMFVPSPKFWLTRSSHNVMMESPWAWITSATSVLRPDGESGAEEARAKPLSAL